MASINKAIIVGHLGKDVEMRYMPNGDAVANFSVATTESWKDKNSGEKKETTEWHRIVAFRKLAEICGEWLKKGQLVYLEGAIKTRKWQDKDGQDRYTTEIVADKMQMLGRRDDASGGESTPEPRQSRQQPASNAGGGFPRDVEDDIPFAPAARGIAGHCFWG